MGVAVNALGILEKLQRKKLGYAEWGRFSWGGVKRANAGRAI